MTDETMNEDETPATRPETMIRIRQVQYWLISAMPSAEIVANGMDRWGIQRGMMYNYISWALQQFKEASATGMDEQRHLHLEMRKQLFNEIMKHNNNPNSFYAALEVLRDMAKLQGLYGQEHQKKEGKHVPPNPGNDLPSPPEICTNAILTVNLTC